MPQISTAALSFSDSQRAQLTTTIGRYQLLEKIGQGGMGVVYHAHDTLLEREVALKIISASIEGNPELRERFFREARAAGQLSHRNIITIHDLGEHEGQPYLAMEYLVGEDLQRRLSQPVPMSLARKLEISAEICEGLAYAHRRGVIHRDIKPANIFITDEGVVKILDFGLARMVTSELTGSNMMLGTLNYMSPEQVRGERTDQRADIFSLGVVLYEILSGRKAFQGDSFATTLYKILQDVPEPLLNIDATLPHEVVRMVEKTLAKARDERYQDLGELARDLALHRQHLSQADGATFSMPAPSAFRTPSDPPRPGVPPRPDSGQRPKSAPRVLDPSEATMLSDAPTLIVPAPPRPRSGRGRSVAAIAGVAAVLAIASWWGTRDAGAPPAQTAPPAPLAAAPPSAGPAVTTPAPTVEAPEAAMPERPVAPPVDSAAVEDARNRMAAAKAAARGAGNIAQRSRAFAAAQAAERDAMRLYKARRMGEAAARFYEATGLFKSAELARAEGSPAPPQAPRAEPPASAPAAVADPSPQPATPRDSAPAEPVVPVPPAPEPSPPIPQVTRNPSPPPAIASESPRALDEGVRDLLRRYEQALEGRSVEGLKRIWPSLQGPQEEAIRREFIQARSIDVQMSPPEITVAGTSATASFTRRYQITTVDGQRPVTSSRTTLTARRAGNDWVIERVRFEAIR